MDEIPDDPDARLAILQAWAKGQYRRLAAEEQRRLHAEKIPHVLAQARQRIGHAASLLDVPAIPVVITKPSELPVERAAVFAELMAGLRDYKWADPIVSECDEPEYIASNAIDLARRHHPDAPWLLYMEDDVILGPDFGLLPGLLSEADELFPNTGGVSFFGYFDEPGWSIHPMYPQFCSMLCAAIRNTDYLAGFRTFIDDRVTQNADCLPGTAVRTFLAIEYDACVRWCPSLVQHADVTSALFGPAATRDISWSYEQAYG